MKFNIFILIGFLAIISCDTLNKVQVDHKKKWRLTTFAVDNKQKVSVERIERGLRKTVTNDTILKISTLIINDSRAPMYLCKSLYYSDTLDNVMGFLYYFDYEYRNLAIKLLPHKKIYIDEYLYASKIQEYYFDYQIMTDSIYKALSTKNEKMAPVITRITSYKTLGNEYIEFSLDDYPYELFPHLIVEKSGVRIKVPNSVKGSDLNIKN